MVKKWLTAIMAVFFCGGFIFTIVEAEDKFNAEDFPYTELSVQVMPEFDYPEGWSEEKPSLLNAYYGTITNKSGQDFKGALEFPVPLDDKDFKVYLVAEFPADNQSEVQRSFKLNKENGTLSWEPTETIKKDDTYEFVIEYYSNPIAVKDNAKNFDYRFTPEADIEKLDIVFYNPMNSENFTLEPAAQNISATDYGQELHFYQYANVKKGEAVQYATTYEKEGNESTLSIISKLPPEDKNQSGETATNPSGTGQQPIIGIAAAIIIGISIIIAGAFVFFAIKGTKSNPNQKIRSKSSKKRVPSTTNSIKSIDDEKKQLRNKLINGKIDEKTYEEKMKKLI
jgi:hypothetical protein